MAEATPESLVTLFFTLFFLVMTVGDVTNFLSKPPKKADPFVAIGVTVKIVILLLCTLSFLYYYVSVVGLDDATKRRLLLAVLLIAAALIPNALSGKKKNLETDDVYRFGVPLLATLVSNYFVPQV